MGILSISVANAQSQAVGINTDNPQNTLHVHSDIDPLRLDGLQTAQMTGNSFLVSDANGVVKKIDNSTLKLLVEARGGENWLASGLSERTPTDKIIINNPTPDNAKSILALSSVTTNVDNVYNSTTGVFTAPEDGLYEFIAVTTWEINMQCTIPATSSFFKPNQDCPTPTHPIEFNGQAAKVRAYLSYKSVDHSTPMRISYLDVPFFRGARLQDQGLTSYYLPNTVTLWMKKGDTMSLMYHFFGGFDVLTKADPFYPQTNNGATTEGARALERIYINGNRTYLKVYKAL